ncbi:MAG: DUF4355 domain-containing protein [Sarcina sp.]
MKKSDLLKLLENFTDEQDVNDALKDTDIVSTAISIDSFKSKVKGDKDFKSYIDSLNDSHHAKAIKTMKEKGTWESEFSNELKIKFPDLVTDPKDKKLLEMEQKLVAMEEKEVKSNMLKDALTYANEKNLPSSFVERFLGDDLDSTKANLDGLADTWSKALEHAVDSKFKNNNYPPGGGMPGGNPNSLESEVNKILGI